MPATVGSTQQPHRTLGRAVRWPAAAILLALTLILAGFILDRTAGRGPDLALAIGGPALTVLLPLSVIWMIVALVLHYWRRE